MSKSDKGNTTRKAPNNRPQEVYSTDNPDAPALYMLESIGNNPTVSRRGFLVASAIFLGGIMTGCGEDSATEPPTLPPPHFYPMPFSIDAHLGVREFDMNPDGISMFSIGQNTIKKWGVPSAKLLGNQSMGEGSWGSCSFDTSGERMFVARADDSLSEVRIYDWASFEQVSTIDIPGKILGICRAAKALVRNQSGENLDIVDLATGTVLRSIPMPPTDEVGLSPDGGWAFSRRGEDGIIQLWSVLQPEEDRDLEYVYTGGIYKGAFSPSGRYFAVLVRNTLIIWDLESDEPVPVTVDFDRWMVRTVDFVFTPDSERIIALWALFHEQRAIWGDVTVLNSTTGDIVRTMEIFPKAPYRVNLSIDGGILAVIGRPLDSDSFPHGVIDYYDYEKSELITSLFDPVDTLRADDIPSNHFSYYSLENDEGQEIMYTISTQNEQPDGSVCNCDHVQGEREGVCSHCAHCYSDDGSCIPVCTCVPF